MLRTLIHRLFSGGAAGPTDPYFDQTTLLLHGDGTNGAQNNTFLDSSTNNFTITRNGNTTQGTFSPFSQDDGKWGAYFDGSGDRLTIAGNSAFDISSGDFTVEHWIYPLSATAQVFSQMFTATNNNYAGMTFSLRRNANGTILAEGASPAVGGSAPAFSITSTLTADLNAWSHVALTRNGSTFTLWINGASAGTATSANTLYWSPPNFYIGSGNDSGGSYYTGYLSNVRVVKGTAVYTSAFTPSTTPLTAISGTQILTCQSNRFVDNSANAFAITVSGNTSIQPFSPFAPSAAYSAATNGGSGYFDGSGDSLALPDNAAFDFGTGDYTIEFWLYRNNTTDDMAVLDGRSTTTTGYLIYLGSGNKIIWFVNSGVITGSTTINAGTWYHIAITRSGTSARLFVNGVQDGSATNSTSTDSGAISIGSKSAGASSSSIVNFNGYIANNRIVKGTAVYTSAFTPPTSPVTAISGTSFLANFTNAGILDNTGRNDLETVGNAQISTSVKKFGTGSLAFDGTGDWLVAPSKVGDFLQLGYGAEPFTIEAWIYPSSVNANRTIVERGGGSASWNSTTGIQYTFYQSSGNKARFQYWTGSTFATAESPGTISANTWHHVAVVYNGTTTTVYLDGNSTGGTTVTTAYGQPSATNQIRVGAETDGSTTFIGYIDDLRITKGVARYTSNFTPPTAAFEDK